MYILHCGECGLTSKNLAHAFINCPACTYRKKKQMTNTPHPHADILRAIADGKDIQVWSDCNNDWLDCNAQVFFRKRLELSTIEFRIKPEVVTGWIAIYNNSQPDVLGSATHIFRTKKEAIKWANNKPHTVIKISYTPGEGMES